MAKTGSYLKLDRGLKNNQLWLLEKPFTKGQAWVDLLLLAQGVDKSREYRGKKQIAKRGYVYTSITFLSTRWGWSRMKVYRFLEKLMIDEMIAVQGWQIDETALRTVQRDKSETANETTNGTTISIVNWDLYQYSETANETPSGSVRRTSDETAKRTYNRKNTEKDTKKEKEYRSLRSDSPSGEPQRGTDAFRAKSHLLLGKDEGTVDDIPTVYRDGTYQSFDNFAEYWRWRNQ